MDDEDKKLIETTIPIMKYFDMDVQTNIYWTIAYRVLFAIYLTKNFVHADE